MTQITVNGNAYSDDGSAAKDMRGGGHRTHLLPMLGDTITDIAAKQSAAASSATASANSATSALNAPGTNATSTTSLAIGTGSKTFTIQTGKAFSIGQVMVVASAATPANWMWGQVTAHNSGTGSITLDVTVIGGAGTLADWTLSLSANPNALNQGMGGATATGNVLLTSISPSAQTVTPSAPGLYITMPAATTCIKSSSLFSVYNAGDYDYGVKDSTGTTLGWIRSQTGAMVGLSDNSTAAGVWALYGLEKIGITADTTNLALNNMATANFQLIVLDASRTCLVYGGTDLYAQVYDASTTTWGAATLVRAGISGGAVRAILSATNQILVLSSNTTTVLEAVTLTLAGTGVTVNSGTKATAALAGNFAAFGRLIAVSTSWVLSYGRATTVTAIRAITVSGTTPTIGAESALTPASGTVPAILFASGSIVRAVSIASTALYAKPYTVSGSALAAGTEATIGCTGGSEANMRAILNGNGNIVVNYFNTSHYAAIFKLTGTVEASSTVSIGAVPTTVVTHTDMIAVTASKTAVIYYSGANWYANIITDTAGTVSVGTELTASTSGNINGIGTIFATSNSVRVAISSGYTSGQFTLDCSGASPALSAVQMVAVDTLNTLLPGALPADRYGVRAGQLMLAGATAYIIGTLGNTASMMLRALGLPQLLRPLPARFSPTYLANDSETWILTLPVSATATTGISITRVGAVA